MANNNREPKYARGEELCTTYLNRAHEAIFLTTTKPNTGYFFLYEYMNGAWVKLGKSTSPLELEDRFNVVERMADHE